MKAVTVSTPMTVGQLARRSGVSIRALREYEGMGLVYRLGRSDSNYRLFDESALWCLHVIHSLRSLGLTVKEIQEISAIYVVDRRKPVGPHLQQKLDQALTRIAARMSELQEIRQRIVNFQAAHASALAGQADLELYARDPRRRQLELASRLSPWGEGIASALIPKTGIKEVPNESGQSS